MTSNCFFKRAFTDTARGLAAAFLGAAFFAVAAAGFALAAADFAAGFFFGFAEAAAFFGARFFLEVDLIRLFFPMKNPFEFVDGLAYSETVWYAWLIKDYVLIVNDFLGFDRYGKRGWITPEHESAGMAWG